MGEVIAFQNRVKSARRRVDPQPGGAQILFFLGVRYLRMDEPPGAAERTQAESSGPGRRKKRKARARA